MNTEENGVVATEPCEEVHPDEVCAHCGHCLKCGGGTWDDHAWGVCMEVVVTKFDSAAQLDEYLAYLDSHLEDDVELMSATEWLANQPSPAPLRCESRRGCGNEAVTSVTVDTTDGTEDIALCGICECRFWDAQCTCGYVLPFGTTHCTQCGDR